MKDISESGVRTRTVQNPRDAACLTHYTQRVFDLKPIHESQLQSPKSKFGCHVQH